MSAPRQPLRPRFEEKVQKTPFCWIWHGVKSREGYGRVSYEGKIVLAHRAAWFLAYGEWPDGIICHTCANKKCVNPGHMYIGDDATNASDAAACGVMSHPVISDWDIQRIRFLGSRGWKNANISKLVGVSVSHVHGVIKRERRAG